MSIGVRATKQDLVFSDMLHFPARNEKAGLVSAHTEKEGGTRIKQEHDNSNSKLSALPRC